MSSTKVVGFAAAVLLLATVVHSAEDSQSDAGATSKARRMPSNGCDRSAYSFNCLKLDAVHFLDKLTQRHEYKIAGGLSLVHDPTVNQTQNTEIIAEMARSYPNDAQNRLNGFVLAKVTNFLRSHTLNVKLLDDSDVDEAQSAVETGRKKDKKGGMNQSIITAALMMKSMLLALALGALALLAGKALVAALMALLLAALNGLKHLTQGKQQTTYEIITKPAHYTSHSHANLMHDEHSGAGAMGATGYGRSMQFELPQQLKEGNY